MHYSYPSIPEGFPEGNPCSTLYITNIDPKVRERSLASFFENYGPIITVKIVRERSSGKSLSYGFVEFVDPRDAESARIKAQYQRIERREILVMFTSERQKLLQEAKIFVKNVPLSASVDDLHNHFATVSPNLFVHLNTDEKGKRLNFGFVHYINIEDAETALIKLQDSELKGQKLQLSRWVVKGTRQIAQIESRRNLYISNLPLLKKKNIENSLRQILSVYGEIESMLIKKAPKLNSYYGLVSFKDPQAAQEALKELSDNPPTLEGTNEPFNISWYQRKSERKNNVEQTLNSIYFSNLKTSTYEEAVRDAFEQYGKILKINMNLWEGVEGKEGLKYGYVVFETETSAEDALKKSPANNKVKKLFAFEPEIELTSSPFDSEKRNKSRDFRRNSSFLQMSPTVSDDSYIFWPNPTPFIDSHYPNVFHPYYPPMGFFPPPPVPFYPNNFFQMPYEMMESHHSSFLYLPDSYSSCYDCECESSKERAKSLNSTNIADPDTRTNSLGSLSTVDADNQEDVSNLKRNSSSDKSNSAEKETMKTTSEVTKEACKPQTKGFKQQGKGFNKANNMNQGRRKYANRYEPRRQYGPVN